MLFLFPNRIISVTVLKYLFMEITSEIKQYEIAGEESPSCAQACGSRDAC